MSGGGPKIKKHDPHAHAIHVPEPRLMRSVPLRFVYNRVAGHGAGPNSSLTTPFIDFLLVTVIFADELFVFGEIGVDSINFQG